MFRPGDRITIRARADARFMMLGGEPMDGPRLIWWNFVSSRKDRIEQAKADWKAARFDTVPATRRVHSAARTAASAGPLSLAPTLQRLKFQARADAELRSPGVAPSASVRLIAK